MECQERVKVLPVFFHVDPSDVRGQKQEYATAFKQHEEKFRGKLDNLNKWRKALADAANLSGYHFSEVSGGESAFINKIVHDILGDIRPRARENNLIGIESHMDALGSLLRIEATKEVRTIGIFGMGGIGKTTIAQALFRKFSYKFEGCSFIKNVRDSASIKDICTLQEKILRDVLVTNHGFMIQDPEYGAEMIQDRFCNKKVLLVLDGVNDVKQLQFLAASHDWFGPGSRIIITTRDEHLLSDANAKYKPVLLPRDQAVELFSMHAFRKNRPPNAYKELSDRVIRYTAGLPLALKALGSFFHGRQIGVWKSALDRLTKIPNSEIFETLRLSFDDLNVYEQKIFLDIACFFKGKKEKHVTRMLDSFGFDAVIGISVLIEKSLITISNKKLGMHDLIQEMGWQIKLKEIEAIVMSTFEAKLDDDQYGEKLGFRADVFQNMKNLRLLIVNREFTACEPTCLPDELQWLCWHHYPFSSLPLSNMHKLVGFELSGSKINHLWTGQKIMQNLKFIHLSRLQCLTRLPDVTGCPNVKRLILSRCTNLVEAHESLGFLERIVYFKINGCLKFLPSSQTLTKFPEFSSRGVKFSRICHHQVSVSIV